MNISKNNQAILLTLIFHAFLVWVAYVSVIRPMKSKNDNQLVGTGGVVVNYGFDKKGSGDDVHNVEELALEKKKVKPTPVVSTPKPKIKITPKTSPPKIVTQKADKTAPAVPSAVSATTAKVKIEPKKMEVQEDALFKMAKQPPKSTGSSLGDGTEKLFKGNQGVSKGDPASSNYTDGGSGVGGVKLDLQNRSFVVLPRIHDDGQSSGRIVIDIKVDKAGTIVSARAGGRGSTITDTNLWKKCEKAVLGARVNASEIAPESQSGKVVFHFTVR